jgi:hypothetical protein
MNRSICILAVGLLLLSSAVFAQGVVKDSVDQTFSVGVNEIAKISVNPVSGVVDNLLVVAPEVGGDAPPAVESAHPSFVRYTSIISGATFRHVTAQIKTGVVPTGLDLFVMAGNPNVATGFGVGALGSGVAYGQLTGVGAGASIVPIVTNIGSGWTGTVIAADTTPALNSGAPITYKLAVDPTDLAGMVGGRTATSMAVTLTLTDDTFAAE